MANVEPSVIDARLTRVVGQVLGVDPQSLDDEASPETIETWDSLNHLNLVMSLEAEFEVSFSPEETMMMSSLAAIREFLEAGGLAANDGGGVYFEDCRVDQLLEVKAFIAKSYGVNYVLGVNEEYFEWQYKRTAVSEGEDYHLRLALYEGEVVGFLGYIPVEHCVGGKMYRGCWLANWMVAPDARQMGLGPLLVRNVSADFDVTLALGANQDARDMLSRMGWTDFGMLRRYVRVIDPTQAQALTGRDDYQWPVSAVAPPEPMIDDSHLVLVERFTDSASRLWDRLLGEDPMVSGSRRSAEFLNWRYAEHRQFQYDLLELRNEHGELGGLAVYRVEKAKNSDAVVVRILELFGERRDLPRLVHFIGKAAEEAQATAIDYFCGEGYGEFLLQLGFLPQEEPAAAEIPILYQPIDRSRAGIRFLADLSNAPEAAFIHQWYVSKADGDQDRPN